MSTNTRFNACAARLERPPGVWPPLELLREALCYRAACVGSERAGVGAPQHMPRVRPFFHTSRQKRQRPSARELRAQINPAASPPVRGPLTADPQRSGWQPVFAVVPASRKETASDS